jgi:hypothetical protein
VSRLTQLAAPAVAVSLSSRANWIFIALSNGQVGVYKVQLFTRIAVAVFFVAFVFLIF